MTEKKYLEYILNLRGLAILIIIGVHTRMAIFSGLQEYKIDKILSILLDGGTIIFLFLSGFLFHHVFAPNLRYKQYLIKKFNFVIVPYLVCSVLPIIEKIFFEPSSSLFNSETVGMSIPGKIGYLLLTGKQFGPYWFIPTIVIFYLIAPLLVAMNRRSFYLYIFPVVFIGGLFTYQFGYYSTILDSFVYFVPIYLLGMFASQYKETIFKYFHVLFPSLLILYLLLVVLEYYNVVVSPKFIGFFNDNKAYFMFNPAKLRFSILSILFLMMFQKLEYKRMKFFHLLGDYSFGIYFVHLYFILLMVKLFEYFGKTIDKGLLPFLLLFAMSTILSLIAVWSIKVVFKNNSRFIIGS